MQLELDINKNVFQNAEVYFSKVKKLKKKIEGIERALVKFQKELEKEKKRTNKEKVVKKPEVKLIVKWYHKFHWFISSEGFLCIGGRDATTNDIIIKKHTDNNDIVFHAEIQGSPFFVIKTEGKKVGEATLNETAIATASFSRAWKLGITSIQVYYVNPEQVSKKAKSGEYLKKGAFMIYGKKNYLNANLELSIGLKDKELMCGPLNAVKKYCKNYLIIKQGNLKASDAAKKIKQVLNVDIDSIIKVLPTGNFSVEKA